MHTTLTRTSPPAEVTSARSYAHELIGAFLAAAGVLIGLTTGWQQVKNADTTVHDGFIEMRTAWATHFMKAITWIFNPLTAVIVSALVGLAVWWLSKRWRNGAYIVAAMTLSAGITQAAKYAYTRERPPRILHLTHESDFSFPSGHTTAVAALTISLVLFLIAQRIGKRLRIFLIIAALVIIIAVAASRLYLGVHWLSDVCAGGLIGSGSALATSRIRVQADPTHDAALPAPANGQGQGELTRDC